MAFTRTTYGVEFNPRKQPEGPRWLGRFIVIIMVATAVSLVIHFTMVLCNREELPLEVVQAADKSEETEKVEPQPSLTITKPVEGVMDSALMKRPAKVRNLLMRLQEAERRRDVEMAITTIERIRSLPGNPAADLDDALARRLGTLNLRKLFTIKSRQWVAEVVVKSGNSASRIAFEHGSTLASMERLNGGKLDDLKIGQKLLVMNHPRFNLVVHRRSQTADLQLNGKFFRRYDLLSIVGGKDGPYETEIKARKLFQVLDIKFKPADLAELEGLLPKGSSVVVSEL